MLKKMGLYDEEMAMEKTPITGAVILQAAIVVGISLLILCIH